MASRIENAEVVRVREHLDDIFAATKLEKVDLPKNLEGAEVLVKMLAAPVNPSDIAAISGFYGDIDDCPFVAGFEGVGEVVAVGSSVTKLAVGDRVIAGKSKLGTWRTHGVFLQDHLITVPKQLDFKAAATLLVNPCSAYLLLTMVELQPGDSVIQNGANSTVGLALIQLAKGMGIRTINVVRNRANIDELVTKMKDLGADLVITDEELRTKKDDLWDGIPNKPKVGIDCVSGPGGQELIRHLERGGTLINYGGMSGQPLLVNPTDLIFKQITVCGFWLTRCNPNKIQKEAIPFLQQVIAEGKFKFPDYELFALKDFQSALKRATAGFTDKKQLLVMDDSLL